MGTILLVASATTVAPAASIATQPVAETRHPPPSDLAPLALGDPLLAPSDPLTADAKTIASQMGWDVSYAVERLQHQDRFGQLLVDLARDHPDTFGGGFTENGPTSSSTVRFKGDVPPDVPERARKLGIEVTFVGGADLSLAELQGLADRLHTDLTGLGSEDVSTGFSVRLQQIQGTANRPVGFEDRSSQEIQDLLPDYARAPTVVLDFVDGPLAHPGHTYGGDWLLDDGAGECTSGFSVTSGTALGVATAGHCAGLNQYRQADGVVYGMTFQSQHSGQWGDFEWHTTTHNEFPKFYADVGDFRSVATLRPAGAIAEGDFYCGFGRSTNDKRCSSVRVPSQACGVFNRFTVMEDNVMQPGDSGGPWFISGTAVGIFYGWCFIDGIWRATFSKADYTDNAIGVTVILE